MPTKVTVQGKYIAAVYDNQALNSKPLHELASEDEVMKWNVSRFPELENRSQIGLKVNSYIPGLSTPETVASGLLLDENDGKWMGAKRVGGDGQFYPLFHEGQFQYKNNWYTLASERTVQEVMNFTSQVESTQTNYRHRFLRQPVTNFGARATIFQRELNLTPRPFIEFELVDELTPYAGHATTIYHKGPFVDFAAVDDTVPQCMIDRVQASSFELLFNQDISNILPVGPYWSTSSLNDGLPALSPLIPSNDKDKHFTKYYPIQSNSFQLYSYDGLNVTQWTATSNFDGVGSGDQYYILNPNAGEIVTNTSMTTLPGDLMCVFNAAPLVEYRLPTKEGKHYGAKESSLARITSNLDRGSTIFALRDPEIFNNLQISISIPSLQDNLNTIWTNSFYGDSTHQIIFKVIDTTTGDPVSGVPLKISKDKGIGQLLGITSNLTLYTDENGEAYTYFLPPMLGDAIGIKDVTRGVDPKELVLTNASEHFFENIPSEIYLYGLYKDDPLMGRVPLDTKYSWAIRDSINNPSNINYLHVTSDDQWGKEQVSGNGFYGADRKGTLYYDGEECKFDDFGTLAGGIPKVSWTVPDSPPLETFDDTDNKIDISLSADDTLKLETSAPTSTFTRELITSVGRWFVEGDFDIQVDWANVTGDVGEYGGGRFDIMVSESHYQSIARGRYSNTTGFYSFNRDSGVTTNNSNFATAVTSGKFRMTRVGSTWRRYYDIGGGWVQLGSSYSLGTDRVGVRFLMEGINGYDGSIEFSNLSIVSGTISNKVGWFAETPGTNRGSNPEFPECAKIQYGPSGLEISDAFSDNLFMRFVPGTDNAIPVGYAVNHVTMKDGVLLVSMGDGVDEAGMFRIDFNLDSIRFHHEDAIAGGYYETDNNFVGRVLQTAIGMIRDRNNGNGYSSSSTDWTIPSASTRFSDITFLNGFEYRCVSTDSGMALFRWLRWHVYGLVDADPNTPSSTFSLSTNTMGWCHLKPEDGELFYVDTTANTINSASLVNYEAQFASTFSPDTSKALVGTRTTSYQYYAALINNKIYMPAEEGIYAVDWPSGDFELEYGVPGSGANHEILRTWHNEVTHLTSRTFGNKEVLIIGTTDGASLQEVVAIDPMEHAFFTHLPDGTQIFNASLLSRTVKRLLYKYDGSATHPILGTLGALAPIRPAYVSTDKFTFVDSLPQDILTNESHNLAGFFVAGPRRTTFSVEVDVDTLGLINTSTIKKSFAIITGLSSFAKGEYISSVGALRYPFGWRLPGSALEASSQLGGALFFTINPVAGSADILFETNEQYTHFPPMFGLQVFVTTP